jgi:lipoprotein
MKKHAIGFIILNALLLTACGSDKDKNDDRLPYDPYRPQTDNNIDYSKAYHGTGYAVSSRSGTINARRAPQTLNSNNFETVRIDGERLPARQVGIYTSGVPRLRANTPITVEGVSYKNFLISGEHYQNSRFGYITRDNTDYIFSQGALTQNMPSTGIARYDGEAIVGRNGQTDAADAKFIVGFGSRSLSGRIIPLRDSKVAFNEVNFNASIDGNSFYNNGLSVGTNGNFYGDNARELGGVFYDNNQELRGSFGATRR